MQRFVHAKKQRAKRATQHPRSNFSATSCENVTQRSGVEFSQRGSAGKFKFDRSSITYKALSRSFSILSRVGGLSGSGNSVIAQAAQALAKLTSSLSDIPFSSP